MAPPKSEVNDEQLINRLAQLEDLVIGQQAQTALSSSQMVGAETFTAELKRLAALDSDVSCPWRSLSSNMCIISYQFN